MTIQFPDLHFRAGFGVPYGNPAQRDILGQYRRTHAACHDAHLMTANMHAIAVLGLLVADQFQPDKLPLRVLLAFEQRFTANEIFLLRFSVEP